MSLISNQQHSRIWGARLAKWLLACGLAIASSSWAQQPAPSPQLQIALSPAKDNPRSPEMGNWMHFASEVRNSGDIALHNVVVWIGLIRVDAGHAQPMDLEDWSAHKAEVIPSLEPGQAVGAVWPMRLIQSGDYRVVISAAEAHAPGLASSPFLDMHVRTKPTVESKRILPVALGMPLLLAIIAALRLRRRR